MFHVTAYGTLKSSKGRIIEDVDFRPILSNVPLQTRANDIHGIRWVVFKTCLTNCSALKAVQLEDEHTWRLLALHCFHMFEAQRVFFCVM